MSDGSRRTGAPRDVPPPRPVTPSPPRPPVGAAEGTGLGRAARAVADAVAGLVGGAFGQGGRPPDGGPDTGAAAGTAPPVDGETRARAPGALLDDLLSAAAPRLPIRSAARLRRAYPGASDDEIADALVARAARLTGGIGAATGGFSAVRRFAPLSLLTLPLELGAESVLIAGVEVVLVGELHELYGRPASGDARARAAAYVAARAARRPDDGAAAAGLGAAVGAGVRALRRRATRAVPTAAPFVVGAAVAGRGNRRATELLAERVLADLRDARGPGSRARR